LLPPRGMWLVTVVQVFSDNPSTRNSRDSRVFLVIQLVAVPSRMTGMGSSVKEESGISLRGHQQRKERRL